MPWRSSSALAVLMVDSGGGSVLESCVLWEGRDMTDKPLQHHVCKPHCKLQIQAGSLPPTSLSPPPSEKMVSDVRCPIQTLGGK